MGRCEAAVRFTATRDDDDQEADIEVTCGEDGPGWHLHYAKNLRMRVAWTDAGDKVYYAYPGDVHLRKTTRKETPHD